MNCVDKTIYYVLGQEILLTVFLQCLSLRLYRQEYLIGKKKTLKQWGNIKMVYNFLQLEYSHIKLQSFDKSSEVTRRV